MCFEVTKARGEIVVIEDLLTSRWVLEVNVRVDICFDGAMTVKGRLTSGRSILKIVFQKT